MPDAKPPQTPNGLGTKAKKLWKEIVSEFTLRADELRLLEDACRELDLVEKLQKVIDHKDFKLRATGSMGQPVAAPELDQIRHHRAAFQKAIQALKLPDEEPNSGSARSSAGRALAAARWRKGA